MSFQPTPEQQAIISAASDSEANLMCNAYAGCAKTTTLELLSAKLPRKRTIALAFNVKIKKEMEKRFPAHFEVKTMNGLGHGAWMRALSTRDIHLDEKKLSSLTTTAIKETDGADKEWWGDLRDLVSTAMSQGMVPSIFPVKGLLPDTPTAWRTLANDRYLELPDDALVLAREILIASINMGFGKGVAKPTISFDDQIYLPTMFNGDYPRYDIVLVDEAQDLSPMNHRQVAKVAGPNGRLIICGDPKQAIYAFRGADSSSMGKLRSLRKDWLDLPLLTTFRCPKAIVERASAHAPGFTAAPEAPDGQIVEWSGQAWDWDKLFSLRRTPSSKIAILSRNNAPVLAMAMKLIRKGIGPLVLGRDIGKNLINLSKKILPADDTPQEACRNIIEKWQDRETTLATANNQEEKIAGITDRAECLLAILESVPTARALRGQLEYIFSNERAVVELATGHRAKGLEWDVVLHLDPWRIPSKYAKKLAQRGDTTALGQEHNLEYVIETRSKHTLVLADLADFS